MKKIIFFSIMAVLLQLSTGDSVYAEPVSWADMVGVTVNGNSLTSTAGTGWGNSGAASSLSFNGDGGVEFLAGQTGTHRMMGLSPSNADANYNTIKYAVYLLNNTTVQVYESGAYKGNFGSHTATDRFSVERTGSVIVYKKNGAAFYTSSIPSSGPLLVDSSFYNYNAVISDVKFIGVSAQPASMTSPSAGASVIDSTVTFRWNTGFSVSEYRLSVGTTLQAVQTTGDIYDQNTGSATSAVVSGISLNGQLLYARLWSKINGSWQYNDYTYQTYPVQNVSWIDAVGVTVNGNSLTSTAGTGWGNSGAASSVSISGDGGVDFRAEQTGTHRMMGLSPSNADANYNTIKYAVYLLNNTTVQVYESGAYKGNFGSHTATDRFSVERTGSVIVYKKNGAAFYTSTIPSSGPLLADTSFYNYLSMIGDARIYGTIGGSSPSQIQTPIDGAMISSSSVSFSWNFSSSATEYRLSVGTTLQSVQTTGDIYDQSQGTNISVTVNNIPLSGQPFYVRLWSLIGGNWAYNDYTYQTTQWVPINFGEAVSGQILTATEGDYFGFQADAGDLIYAAFGKTAGGTYFFPFIELYDSNSALIASTGTSPLTAVIPAEGDYYIKVIDTGYFSPGDYTLTLQRANNPAGAVTLINFGDSISNTTDTIADIDVYGFTVQAGDKINIPFNKTGGDGYYMPNIQIFDASGTEIINTYTSPLTVTATTSGTYYIFVTDHANDRAGSYSFTLVENLITLMSVTPTFIHPDLNETSTVEFELQRDADVTISVYKAELNTSNALVKTLIETPISNVPMIKGTNTFAWDGKDSSGNAFGPSAYIFTINAVASDRSMLYDPAYVPGIVTIQNASYTPAFFDPYQGENAVLTYDLVEPAFVTLKAGISNTVLAKRTIMVNQPRNVLNNIELWDGRDDNGNIVDANTYMVYGWTSILPDNAIVVEGVLSVDALHVNPYAFFPAYGEITGIEYGISSDGLVTVEVLDPAGAPARMLENAVAKTAGAYALEFNGRDDVGRLLSVAGNYIVRVTLENNSQTQSVVKTVNLTIF